MVDYVIQYRVRTTEATARVKAFETALTSLDRKARAAQNAVASIDRQTAANTRAEAAIIRANAALERANAAQIRAKAATDGATAATIRSNAAKIRARAATESATAATVRANAATIRARTSLERATQSARKSELAFRHLTPALARASRQFRALNAPTLGTATAIGRSAEAAQRAQAQFSGLERFMRRLLVTVGTLTIAVRFLSNVFGVLDEFTNVQNRLRLVTDGTEELADSTQELLDISNRTRTAFDATATLYSRTALAARELGLAQSELLLFTERVNQATILSGVGAQEARGGLIQLAQGIASDRLGGEEYRSVAENLPFVLDVIARHLGTTRGELRELSRQGVLTGRTIIEAFTQTQVPLEELFMNTVPTLSQSFVVLRNRWQEFISDANASTGVTTGLSFIILGLASNIGLFVTSLTALAGVIAVAFAPAIWAGVTFVMTSFGAAVAGVTAALSGLTVALLSNPFTLPLVAVGVLAGAIFGLREEIFGLNDAHRDAVASGDEYLDRVDKLTDSSDEYKRSLSEVNAELVKQSRLRALLRVEPNIGFDEVNQSLDDIISGRAPTAFERRRNAINTLDDFRGRIAEQEQRDREQRIQNRSLALRRLQAEEDSIRNRLNERLGVDLETTPRETRDSILEQIYGPREQALSRLGEEERRPGFTSRFGFGHVAQSANEFILRAEREQRDLLEAAEQSLLDAQREAARRISRVGAPGSRGFGRIAESANEFILREERQAREAEDERQRARQDALDRLGDESRRPGFTSRFGFGNIAESASEQRLRIEEQARAEQDEQTKILEERTNQFRRFVHTGIFGPLEEGFKEFISGTEANLTETLRRVGEAIFENIGNQVLTRATGNLAASLVDDGLTATLGGFLGFQSGGQFRVQGRAGVDRNLVPLRLSRGEVVTIDNSEQQRRQREEGGGSIVFNPTININPDEFLPHVIDSPAFQSAVDDRISQRSPRGA